MDIALAWDPDGQVTLTARNTETGEATAATYEDETGPDPGSVAESASIVESLSLCDRLLEGAGR